MIFDADGGLGNNEPGDDAFRLEFLEPFREEPVTQARDRRRDVGESHGTAKHGPEDDPGPAAPDELHRMVEPGTECDTFECGLHDHYYHRTAPPRRASQYLTEGMFLVTLPVVARLQAELTAGWRAIGQPAVPGADALATAPGRAGARVAFALTGAPFRNQAAVREAAFLHLALQLPPPPGGLVVDVGAGLSPLGWNLARAWPAVIVQERDLPGVLDRKRQRLERLGIPSTWQAIAASIEDPAPPSRPVDLLVCQGLLVYFEPDAIVTILERWRREWLAPGGVLLCDVLQQGAPGGPGRAWRRLRGMPPDAVSGPFRGMVPDRATADSLLERAGFSVRQVVPLSALAAAQGWTLAGRNEEFLCLAGHPPGGLPPFPGSR